MKISEEKNGQNQKSLGLAEKTPLRNGPQLLMVSGNQKLSLYVSAKTIIDQQFLFIQAFPLPPAETRKYHNT